MNAFYRYEASSCDSLMAHLMTGPMISKTDWLHLFPLKKISTFIISKIDVSAYYILKYIKIAKTFNTRVFVLTFSGKNKYGFYDFTQIRANKNITLESIIVV